MSLKEKVQKLPPSPGVYLMKDSLNSIIYVGKSKNLKSRVGSYFQNSKSHSPKVVKLVKNLKDFDYILTDTEFEAFILECKLIKEIKPIYNRLMKNPKSYSYVYINLNEEYPDITITQEPAKDNKTLCYGPYTSTNTIERAIEGIKECCRIQCSNNLRKGSSCLNYSLGLCIGMCLNDKNKEEYLKIMDKIIGLLKGSDKSIIELIENNMNAAAEKFDFENAAKYRDYFSAVNYLISSDKVVEYTRKNRNIALLEYLNDTTIKFFLLKGNKILFSEKYNLTDFKNLKPILKNNILSYFKNETSKDSIDIGKEEIDEAQIIYSYLKSKTNGCRHAVISESWLNSSMNSGIDKVLDKLI
ncbi:MAG: GIY-YIG nuclease family protein [Bacillota bacterium]|nr:GIY-YIG nuclease family protein [Bacillota bacterium]